MIDAQQVRLLGLSRKEVSVLSALIDGSDTPLRLSRATHVSRPGVYGILRALKARGLVISHIQNGKKVWALSDRRRIEQDFFETKRSLLHLNKGEREVYGASDSVVTVHRGAEACRKVIRHIIDDHKNDRIYGFQGDVAANNWNDVFSLEETHHFNRMIKKHSLIMDVIMPDGLFERQTKELGVEWAKNYEGRAARTNIIDEEYFQHGGQLFLFKESIYLIALREELIIEVRNSDIQKMLMAFFRFMQDNSPTIDANELLRRLAKTEEK